MRRACLYGDVADDARGERVEGSRRAHTPSAVRWQSFERRCAGRGRLQRWRSFLCDARRAAWLLQVCYYSPSSPSFTPPRLLRCRVIARLQRQLRLFFMFVTRAFSVVEDAPHYLPCCFYAMSLVSCLCHVVIIAM